MREMEGLRIDDDRDEERGRFVSHRACRQAKDGGGGWRAFEEAVEREGPAGGRGREAGKRCPGAPSWASPFT